MMLIRRRPRPAGESASQQTGRRQHLWATLLTACALTWPAAAQAQPRQPAAPLANNDGEIIYIDNAGYLRVYDYPAGSDVRWQSPDAPYRAFDTGDFNDDGDAEIVAIGGSGSGGRLVVFDPVLTTGPLLPDQIINEIPWDTLYSVSVPGTPVLVAVYGYEPPATASASDATATIFKILARPAANPDGRTWSEVAVYSTNNRFTDVALGELELRSGGASDEVVLINEESGSLELFRRLGATLERFYRDESESRPWSDAVVGRTVNDLPVGQLITVRNVDIPLRSWLVQEWRTDHLVDITGQALRPAPRVVFTADINGSGDDEIVMMRQLPANSPATTPHLILRNRSGDVSVTFEVRLDNAFRAGAAGDIDGDGFDEIVVASPSELRFFTQPSANTNFQSASIAGDARNLGIANLDAAGFIRQDKLAASPSTITPPALAAGSAGIITNLGVFNSTSDGGSIPFSLSLSPPVGWISWAVPGTPAGVNRYQTPNLVEVTVSARELLPGGTYGANLIVTSLDPLAGNSPIAIPIVATIGEGVVLRPAAVTQLLPSCIVASSPVTVSLQVIGTGGSVFAASVAPSSLTASESDETDAGALVAPAMVAGPDIAWPETVPWILSASSVTNTVPSSIQLVVDPAQVSEFANARVTINASVPEVGAQVRRSTVTVKCVAHLWFGPLGMR
jgi:hypothetical protein